MARIIALNGPLLASAQEHGRRVDRAAIARKVRDELSLTWVPPRVTGDPLALVDRLSDHVAGAFVPKAKAKALHMLVKLPESVPVATEFEARAALEMVVQFVNETYGGEAVFAARMDRDERSLNTVDVFFAPKYLKETKRDSKKAISLTRHGKLLAQKRGIVSRSQSAKGSMQAQGSALQDELAEWLRSRGFAAERGRKKMLEADDWKSPEILGAKKDREAAERLINKVLVEAEKDRESASEKLIEASLVFERAQDREDRWRKKVEAVETMHIEAAESRRNARHELS